VAEVEELRAACRGAIDVVLAAAPDLLTVVGGVGAGEIDKPLSVTVGRSLLNEAGVALPIEQVTVRADAPPAECEAVGRALTRRTERVGLLVMADGSARRTVKAPGYLDERAAPFDQRVEAALADADAAGLAGLEPDLATELLAAGRAAWQVMAGAAAGAEWQARLAYSADPFGVWYPVATWLTRR
jgi:hypothetical protein